MKIVIQRHGESGVVIDNKPCSVSLVHAKNSLVVCSTFERSRHSVKLLEISNFMADPSFCEAELSVVNVPLLKTSPYVWSMIFRVFWFLGLSNGMESKKEIAGRVKVANEILESLAEEHKNVLLVGHGIMNRLLGKEPVQRG